ncbi:MAG: lysophospholipid acyltransferase family protein [Acidiferrobacterales bacterium]
MNDQKDDSNKKKTYLPNIIGRLLIWLTVRLPVPLLSVIGQGFGLLFYFLDYRRTNYARVNLKICFPELSDKKRKKLLIRHFKNLGQSLFCTLGITWFQPRKRLVKYVNFINMETLEQEIKNKTPIIILAPHFVGLELAVSRLGMTFTVAGMYRPPRKNILHWAVDYKRRQFGGIPFESDSYLKKLIRVVRDGIPFFYLPDMDQGRHTQHVYATFFGHPAATITALNRIALLTRARVIPCIACKADKPGYYDVTFLPPMENFPTKDLLADANKMNRLIEEYVRKRPAEYFWIHRRFKTQDTDGEKNGRALYK